VLVTSRPAGRHRKGAIPQTPPRLQRPHGPLLLGYPGVDRASGYYLNSAIVPNGGPLFASSGGRQALRAAVARDRRTFAVALSATAAGVTAAVLFGTFAPLHSTWMPSGGSGAAGGPPPQTPAPWSATPLGVRSGPAMPPGPAQDRPWRPGERAVPSRPARHARPPQHTRPPQQARPPGAGRETGPQWGSRGRHAVGASTGPGATTRKETGVGQGPGAAPALPPGRHRRAPALVVRYLVDHQWPGGFQGEVQVINRGARPIAGWQVVVALPADTVTSFTNASGYVSDHIMLLGPASPAQVVPAGGTLDVVFAAAGPQTVPQACAFDGILCG
jgi:cellulose binding protein with CBM2 domain